MLKVKQDVACMRYATLVSDMKHPNPQRHNIGLLCRIEQTLYLYLSLHLSAEISHRNTQERHKALEDGHMPGLTPDMLDGTLGLLRPR